MLNNQTTNAFLINKKMLAEPSESRLAGLPPDLNTKALLLMLQQLSAEIKALKEWKHEQLKKVER